MGLTVGQKLWFVPAYNRQPYEVEIKKIGRKWAHTDSYSRTLRIDVETMRPHEDDGNGQCYLSREDYEAKQALSAAWREFHRAILYVNNVPGGMTVEKIAEARQMLGL